jgi:type II secretory pathway predicted ATPase ExeA
MPRYTDFFDLTASPFGANPIRPLVLDTGPLRRVATWIRNELGAGTVRVAVIGSPGIGKTSLALALTHMLDDRIAFIPDPTRPWEEIEDSIGEQFLLEGYDLSHEALLARNAVSASKLVIVMDDADHLSDESLARFKSLLDHTDERGNSLVRCVLLARRRAQRPEAARWVLDEVEPRIELAPMLARELKRYIEARLENAGWRGAEIFNRAAIEAIHHRSGGVPRIVNEVCEELLTEAAQRSCNIVDGALARGLTPTPMGQSEVDEPALRNPNRPTSAEVQGDGLLPMEFSAADEPGSEQVTEPALRIGRVVPRAGDVQITSGIEDANDEPGFVEVGPAEATLGAAPRALTHLRTLGSDLSSRVRTLARQRLAGGLPGALRRIPGRRHWKLAAAVAGLLFMGITAGRIASVRAPEGPIRTTPVREQTALGEWDSARQALAPTPPGVFDGEGLVITPMPARISVLEPLNTDIDALEAFTGPWPSDLLEALAGDLQATRPDFDLETHGSGEALLAGIEAGRAETPLGAEPVTVAEPRGHGGREIAAAEKPPAPPAPTVRKPDPIAEIKFDWPADLDLSLGSGKGPAESSRPRLALPEPKLSENRAAGGSE